MQSGKNIDRTEGEEAMGELSLKGDFQFQRYNALRAVEEVNTAVRTDGALERLLREAAPLFIGYGVVERFGVSLLHAHNLCPEGAWMVEQPDRIMGIDVLTTRLTSTPPTESRAVPTLWEFGPSRYHPLEFSTDPCARRLWHSDEVNSRFLEEFGSLLNDHSVSGLLGLAIIDRELYESAADDEIAVEYSTTEPANVVFRRNRIEINYPVIETAWTFNSDPETYRVCPKICKKSCVVILNNHTSSHTNMHGSLG
jgi:hypothetical protein